MNAAIAFVGLVACALFSRGVFLLLRPGSRLADLVAGKLAVLIGAITLMAVISPAFAGERVYAVPIPPELLAGAVDLALVALATVGGFVVRRVLVWLKVDTDSKLARRLDDGMVIALGCARDRLLLIGANLDTIQTRSEMVAIAARYLLPKMPETMRALRIDAAGLEERLAARLDQVVPLPGQATISGRPVPDDL
ncbi:hypothetical protein [Azospirillum halopraeferens]|uniref:hypothetical protein n=1 Tax=Azospirillum halopraeferens TaxID=34010 RepID=UPI0003F4CFA1|nr:hypothetical protein [Azospirillum halopraeferens]